MPRSALASLLLIASTVAPPAAAQAPSAAWTFSDWLTALHDLDALARPPQPGEECVQFSSYDRRSDAGPADADAWFANGDRGQYLRSVERHGRTEHVLVDADGPGAVVRIWSANPSGRLFFYLDGEEEPRWTVDFAALLKGELDGLGEPLCGMRSRGGNCHLPIPFAERIEVTSDSSDFYYQVNVRRLPDGATTESFQSEWLESRREAIDGAASLVRGGGAPREGAGAGHWRRAVGEIGDDGEIWSQRIDGPGVLSGLRLRVAPADEPDRRADLLRALLLRVECDGERTVDVPVSDFFASAPAFGPWHGLALGVLEDGTGYCDFPMPCAESLHVSLVADGGLPCDATVDWSLAFEPGEVSPDALRFRASWHLVTDRRTRPFGDHLVLDASGPGRLVGTSLVVRNPTKVWWGEGDEKLFVDGEEFPSTFGTGTEDYFGYAWCCPEPFDHPLHAQPQCDGPGNFGYTSNVRLHIADQVPFHERLRFDLEVWHWHDVVVDYATTAYWYGAEGATSGLPPVADAAVREPVEMTPPAAFVATDAIEAESLKVIETSGGEVQRQDMSSFDNGRWSRGEQLWWMDGEPGDRLVLELPVARAGRYRVEGAFTRAPDYAIAKLSLGGEPLGGPIDLYARGVQATEAMELGVVELDEGPARLVVDIAGRHEEAAPRHMVGIDYVRLVPIDAGDR